MKGDFETTLEQIEKKVLGFFKYRFIVTGVEIQQIAKKGLQELLVEIRDIKKGHVQRKDEKNANSILTYELIINAVIYEIDAVIEIKKDNPSKAWDCLVMSQECIEASLRIGFRNQDLLINYRVKLHYLEKLLFPQIVFMSAGFIAHESQCSICKYDYDNCDHIKGMAYMGSICIEIFNKIDELKEISFVNDPADKRCRVYTVEQDKKKIDVFTLRDVSE